MCHSRYSSVPLGLFVIAFVAAFAFASCGKEGRCHVPIGDANCQIDPNSPLYPGINNCDGYEYLVGGANGLVVVRVSFNDFACYERSCPLDSGRLEMASGYGNIVLSAPNATRSSILFSTAAPSKVAAPHATCISTAPTTTAASYTLVTTKGY